METVVRASEWHWVGYNWQAGLGGGLTSGVTLCFQRAKTGWRGLGSCTSICELTKSVTLLSGPRLPRVLDFDED